MTEAENPRANREQELRHLGVGDSGSGMESRPGKSIGCGVDTIEHERMKVSVGTQGGAVALDLIHPAGAAMLDREVGRDLGHGLAQVVMWLDIDCFLIGGGVGADAGWIGAAQLALEEFDAH